MKEIIEILVVFVIVMLLLFGTVYAFGAFMEYNTCRSLTQASDYSYQWFTFGGCRVLSQEGYWVYHNDINITDGQIEMKGDK